MEAKKIKKPREQKTAKDGYVVCQRETLIFSSEKFRERERPPKLVALSPSRFLGQ